MAGRCVDETRTVLVGYMIAGEQGDTEIIATQCLQRVIAKHNQSPRAVEKNVMQLFESNASLTADLIREIHRNQIPVADLCPIVRRRLGHFVKAVLNIK